MKKYDIYFVGSNNSFVSSIFLDSLINFLNKNFQFELKYIIDTDSIFAKRGMIYKLKNKIISIIYFFFNKKYHSLLKTVNNEFKEKKDIITQAKINNIKYEKFSNFDKKINRKSSILINCGGIKIFKFFFYKKFNICINYHNAEIPKFRGAYSNSLSLFHNNFNTYFCFHYINSKIDMGYVFYKYKINMNNKIKHNLFYEIIKIKMAAKNIKKIFAMAFKKKKHKFLYLKGGNYYSLSYYKNLFLNINQFSFKQIKKYIEIFGGIYYMGDFVTGIKRSKRGIQLKDCKIKIIEIKYLPKSLDRFFNTLFFIKS